MSIEISVEEGIHSLKNVTSSTTRCLTVMLETAVAFYAQSCNECLSCLACNFPRNILMSRRDDLKRRVSA